MKIKNSYLALGYACNERCRCCPLVHKKDREQFVPVKRLQQEADMMVKYGITDVTLSGGEPTIHPNLFQLISYFHERKIGVHILSNGERFSDLSFASEFLKLSEYGELTVTTTFHSWKPEEHEYQNGTHGSFQKSLNGISYLDKHGIPISVKHCITANNYQELPEYMKFVLDAFSSQAEIQLWGIDLYGLEKKYARENFADFQKIRPYIQEAIDIFEQSGRYRKQVLTINNLPLCMCDCYYWRYFTSPEYDSYIDHKNDGVILDANSGPVSIWCRDCSFRSECMGAYFSNFDILGNNIVAIPQKETMINSYQPRFIYFSECNIDKMTFSPYLIHRLEKNGYIIVNYLTGEDIILRLATEQILQFQKYLSNGVSEEKLITYLNECKLNGIEMMNELIRKGIIE